MRKEDILMAKKKNPLACPSCQTRLMESCGKCIGVMLTCPHCGASILADIDESGRMRLSYEPPTIEKPSLKVATN